MPNSEAGEDRWDPFSHWEVLSAEVVRYNMHVGTNVAEYWRRMAEIHVAVVMAIAVPRETPPARRRKFRVINGGQS